MMDETFKIRYHHLEALYVLSTYLVPRILLNFPSCPFDTIHEEPGISKYIANEIAEKKAVNQFLQLQQLLGKRSLSRDETLDFDSISDSIGRQGEFIEQFKIEYSNFLFSYLCLPPHSPVELTMGIDGICKSCQLKTTSNVGGHCLQTVRKSDNKDYAYYHSTLSLLTKYNLFSQKNELTVLTDAATVRNRVFLADVYDGSFKYKFPLLHKAGF